MRPLVPRKKEKLNSSAVPTSGPKGKDLTSLTFRIIYHFCEAQSQVSCAAMPCVPKPTEPSGNREGNGPKGTRDRDGLHCGQHGTGENVQVSVTVNSHCYRPSWPFTTTAVVFFETSGTINPAPQCHIAQESSPLKISLLFPSQRTFWHKWTKTMRNQERQCSSSDIVLLQGTAMRNGTKMTAARTAL